jgi:hypothetical protein
MHLATSVLFFAAALGSLAEAAQALKSDNRVFRRQAFDPDETTRPGANCVEAFGPGYIECVVASATTRSLCINPTKGETCCQNLCT